MSESTPYAPSDETIALLARAEFPRRSTLIALGTGALATVGAYLLDPAAAIAPAVLTAFWSVLVAIQHRLRPRSLALEKQALVMVQDRWLSRGTTVTRLALAELICVSRAPRGILVNVRDGRCIAFDVYPTRYAVTLDRGTVKLGALDGAQLCDAFLKLLRERNVEVGTPPRWSTGLWRRFPGGSAQAQGEGRVIRTLPYVEPRWYTLLRVTAIVCCMFTATHMGVLASLAAPKASSAASFAVKMRDQAPVYVTPWVGGIFAVSSAATFFSVLATALLGLGLLFRHERARRAGGDGL